MNYLLCKPTTGNPKVPHCIHSASKQKHDTKFCSKIPCMPNLRSDKETGHLGTQPLQRENDVSPKSKGLKNSSASKRSPLPGMSGNLDPLDVVNPTVIESFPSHHIHSMSEALQLIAAADARTLQQYEEVDCSSGSHGIDEEGVGAVENGEMEADGLSGPSHLGDTQPLVIVQPGGNQLTLSFQGEVYVFDSVSPEKVQAVLLLLGSREMQAGSNPFPSSSIPTKRGDMPHRIASLMRFREKRKEHNFEKKIRYTARKEVASRIPKFKMLSTQSSSLHKVSSVHASSSRNEQCADVVWGSQNADALVLKESEIQGTLVDQNESTPEVDSFRSVDSFEGGRSFFNGTSHPLEPMDTDMVKSVYVAIDQEKSDAGCLMKGISTKGPKFSLCLYYYYCTERMAASPLTTEYHSCSIRHEDLHILLLGIAGIVVIYMNKSNSGILEMSVVLELLYIRPMRNHGIACIA
ncbi:hypothetical protein ZIOFF_075756 [Zingiber officinale]|uniref:Uncharacterized protein n=1 Tax=Zingiber officinale TaxID=94328 RepID=A0A8J5C0V4_ZINOF|nr:hypothetical protein ZIOFF_075756 [Zingiber officinale]